MRYKITIEYNGKYFFGWQKQKDRISVQEAIEEAIFKITGEKIEIVGSGRTDAGVHAFGQVAHFDLNYQITAFKLLSGLNHHLKNHRISILECVETSDSFHSRFLAKLRTYEYHIINRRSHLALLKNYAWHIPYFLDLDQMIAASKYLIGKHDFSSFRDSECQSKNPVRTIFDICINKEKDLINIRITAKSFLHHMVRNITGTLVMVGRGKIKPEYVKEILLKKDRKYSGPNAPAYGLYLADIKY